MMSMNATASRAAARPARAMTKTTTSASLSSATTRCSPTSSTAAFGCALPSHRVSLSSSSKSAVRRPPRSAASARSAGLAVRAVLDVDESTFEEEVLKSPVPVLVDFWAVWCGPCKLVAPLMSAVEKEMDGKLKVVKVNADPCPNLVEKYKVYGLPTLSLFEPGNTTPVAQREGAIGKKTLLEWLAANGIEAGVAK